MQRAPMLKMAANRVKRERKTPKRFIDEFAEAKTKQCKKIKTTDKNIYPVEIMQVDKARNMVKFISKGTARNLTNGGHAMGIICP